MSLLRALNCIFQVKTVARDDNNYLIGLLCKCSELTGVKYLTMCSVLSITLRPHGLWPSRCLCVWNFPGKNTGVGCHFLLQYLTLCIDDSFSCKSHSPLAPVFWDVCIPPISWLFWKVIVFLFK